MCAVNLAPVVDGGRVEEGGTVRVRARALRSPYGPEASLALLRTGAPATIDLAPYEATNVAVIRWQDQAAAARLRQRIWTIAELGTLIRADPLLGDHVAELAHEHGLSSYDAAYLAGS